MAGMSCQKCKKGVFEMTVLPKFQTKLKGIPFVVEDAKVLQCPNCGEKVYDAKEIERWEQVLKDHLQSKGLLITSEQVREVRDVAGLSVADLACLLGVTRQTVYGWESKSTGGVQLGPASLLLGLLHDEVVYGNSIGVLNLLVNSVSQRGQRIKATVAKIGASASVRDVEGSPARKEVGLRDLPEGRPCFVPAA